MSKSNPSSNQTKSRRYDPLDELDHRYDDWELNVVPMGERQKKLILWATKTIYVDRDLYVEDPEFVAAHLLACLDNPGEAPSLERDQFADAVAEINLDRPESRPS